MNNFDYQQLRAVVVANGGNPVPLDSIHDLLKEWLRGEGGTPVIHDSRNDLLRKLATARGVGPQNGDSNIKLLQRIANLGPGNGTWDCLKAILAGPEVEESPLPAAPPGAPENVSVIQPEDEDAVTLLWTLAPGEPTTSMEMERRNVINVAEVLITEWTPFTPTFFVLENTAWDGDIREIAQTDLEYRIRAVGAGGASEWVSVTLPNYVTS